MKSSVENAARHVESRFGLLLRARSDEAVAMNEISECWGGSSRQSGLARAQPLQADGASVEVHPWEPVTGAGYRPILPVDRVADLSRWYGEYSRI